MTRYFFDVVNGHRLEDPAGIDCPSDQAAAVQGKAIAAQIAAEVPNSIARRHVSVLDVNGREIAKVMVGAGWETSLSPT